MTVYTKSYEPPKINEREILRYAGVRESSPEIMELLSTCLAELEGRLTYKVCYCEVPISVEGDNIDFGFSAVKSSKLGKNLSKSSSAVLFAATVGIELDRLIARYSKLSPAKAFMLQAIGAERIESLCDVFNQEIKERAARDGGNTAPRFSPGYGDLPLEFQRDIFSVLDCPRKIGLTLNDCLLMSPSKSVTAIIGIGKASFDCNDGSCKNCDKTECTFRRML